MPRRKHAKEKTSIPSTIQRSEKHAQHLWRKAHDSAVKTYGEGSRAHRVAYAALKHEYKKEGDKWVAKGWKGPSDPQAAQGARDKPKPTARGKVARTEKEARRKARAARKEYARSYRRRKRTKSKSAAARRSA